MRYLSVCSGIEAATVAWGPLEWQAVAFAEIERFPSAVLKHHYPETPNWGDMTKFREWPVPYRGKPAADGPRYKALGNSMAVPVMRWIGQRIAMVERLAQREEP